MRPWQPALPASAVHVFPRHGSRLFCRLPGGMRRALRRVHGSSLYPILQTIQLSRPPPLLHYLRDLRQNPLVRTGGCRHDRLGADAARRNREALWVTTSRAPAHARSCGSAVRTTTSSGTVWICSIGCAMWYTTRSLRALSMSPRRTHSSGRKGSRSAS